MTNVLVAMFFTFAPYVLLIIVLIAIGFASHDKNDGKRDNGKIVKWG